jgi:hypothetical protein
MYQETQKQVFYTQFKTNSRKTSNHTRNVNKKIVANKAKNHQKPPIKPNPTISLPLYLILYVALRKREKIITQSFNIFLV